MTSIGIWGCQHRELQPISFGKQTGPARHINLLGGITSAGHRIREEGAIVNKRGHRVEYEMNGLEDSHV